MAEAFAKLQQKQDQISYEQAVEASICSPPLGYVVNSHDIKWNYRFEEDIKTYIPLIYSLEHALSKPIFCCGGSIQLSSLDKFAFQVMKPRTSEAGEEKWEKFKLTDLRLKELLEYCNPAPFGDLKKMRTVVDPEVRLAYEVESNRFKIEKEIELPKSIPRKVIDFPGRIRILQLIKDTLAHGRIVNFDQYKLNVYGKGGFFKPHVDSPSGHDMIGTLVLCFPSPHKGGELYVSHDGLQHVFDFSQHSDDPSKVQWAAFYSDCIHEVKPVLEGHRVTVTYNITLPVSNWDLDYISRIDDPKLVEEHFEASSESPSLTSKVLAKIHSELEKIRQDSPRSSPFQIGLLLKHKYTSEGLQPQFLKGEDKVFFDFLAEKKWKCKLMSVLSRYQTAVIYPDGLGEDGELDESHEIYQFNPSAAKSPWALSRYVPRHTNQPWLRYREDYRKWRVGIPFIDIYSKEEDRKQVVRNIEGRGSWIGNQVEGVGVDKIYLDSAAIVDLEP